MQTAKNVMEEEFKEMKAAIDAESAYKLKEPVEKKTMSAVELGQLLGLKKTDRYWLLHKHYFEWEEINGVFRINIASFEKWYANQIKYKKVNGEEPGKELKAWSYSPREISEILGINEPSVYEIIKKYQIKTVIVDYWKRIPKEDFYRWYHSQSRYRTTEDRERDAAIEAATITMPEMARLLGLTRSQVYEILKRPEFKDIFEIVIVADRKRITKESFNRFLEVQDKYRLDAGNKRKEVTQEENTAVENYRRRNLKKKRNTTNIGNSEMLTIQEAAIVANVGKSSIHYWMDKEYFPIVRVMNVTRIHRKEFEAFLIRRKSEMEGERSGINKGKKR